MLAGYPPFYADNPLGIYEAILGGKIDWPQSVDGLAKDLIRETIKKRVLGHCQTALRGPKLLTIKKGGIVCPNDLICILRQIRCHKLF